MGKHVIQRASFLGLVVFSSVPVLAQDAGGFRLTFGVEETLDSSRNLDLETPSTGSATESSTRLSFGLVSETATERLALDVSGALKLSSESDAADAGKIGTPQISLTYSREAANAAFSASARYQRERLQDVAIAVPTEEFPDGFDDLKGGGQRAEYGLGLTLDLGTASPLGFGVIAGLRGVDYFDTSDPDLYSSRTTSLSGTVRLRFSPASEGRVILATEEYTAEDAGTTNTQSNSIEVGLNRQFSSRTTLDAALGFSRVETEEFDVTTVEQGPTVRVGLTYEMVNGTVDTNFSATNDRNGDRLTLDFGRSLELPKGALSARLGVTRIEGQDAELIGSLAWSQIYAAGQITAALRRDVASTDTDVQTATTLATIGVTREINAISGLGLDFSYALIDETAANEVARSDITVRYTRALTADWNMNLGMTYRTRNEENADRADGQSVFLTLNRTFDLRP